MVGSPVRFLFACYEELYMLTNHEVIYIYFIDYAIAQSVKLCHVFRDVIYLFIYLCFHFMIVKVLHMHM